MSHTDLGDPDWMHAVSANMTESLLGMIGRLRLSISAEQFLYREAELDDLWRHLKMECRRAESLRQGAGAEFASLASLTFDAHECVASGAAERAASILGVIRERWIAAAEYHHVAAP